VAISCASDPTNELMLFDFETDAELDRIHWRCFTMFSLADEHSTHGKKCLKMELYPSNWPGWAPVMENLRLDKYKKLAFDLYNPENSATQITIRVDDKKDYPDYDDRYNQKIFFEPGINNIKLQLDQLKTSGTSRNLNIKRISRIKIFMAHPDRKYVLYLDNVRLLK